MTPDSTTPPSSRPPRRLARWAGVAVALIAAGWAGWYFGVELPDRKEAAAAAALRAANARTIPDLNLDLVFIAPGEFQMGTPEQSFIVKWYYAAREKLTKEENDWEGLDNGSPVTWVTLTQAYWIGRTAVTQAQYEGLMGTNPSGLKAAGKNAPVEQVSWDDAMAFCAKLTAREMAAGRLPVGYVYTLPTEAQREYACRAGTISADERNLDAMAWYGSNSGGTTHSVATKDANAWGLYDMHGNVSEWCRDWYDYDDYPGGDVTNPMGPSSGRGRVVRGGNWEYGTRGCHSAFREGFGPGARTNYVGFRVALAPAL